MYPNSLQFWMGINPIQAKFSPSCEFEVLQFGRMSLKTGILNYGEWAKKV